MILKVNANKIVKLAGTAYIFEPARNPQITRGTTTRGGSIVMKHFTIWDWGDFSRGVADERVRAAMEAHLSSGCPRCERTVRVLRGVSDAARSEAQYEPPDRAMRYARALHSLHPPAKTSFAQLVCTL